MTIDQQQRTIEKQLRYQARKQKRQELVAKQREKAKKK